MGRPSPVQNAIGREVGMILINAERSAEQHGERERG